MLPKDRRNAQRRYHQLAAFCFQTGTAIAIIKSWPRSDFSCLSENIDYARQHAASLKQHHDAYLTKPTLTTLPPLNKEDTADLQAILHNKNRVLNLLGYLTYERRHQFLDQLAFQKSRAEQKLQHQTSELLYQQESLRQGRL